MSKFKKKAQTKQEIPTSSMPDVVFMLLFFFMVTTKMRETNINVEQRMPQATQLKKLAKKSLVAYLYVGAPKKAEEFVVKNVDIATGKGAHTQDVDFTDLNSDAGEHL